MKTVIITGATSGTGMAVCRAFLKLDYHVIGVGRAEGSCEAARNALLSENPGSMIAFFYGDMMQQREIHRLADELTAYLAEHCAGRLDTLVHNAGCIRNWYATTEEGYEQQFSLNHLASFLLTYRMYPSLKRCGGRVILTSGDLKGTAKMNWKDIMFRKKYRPVMAYRQSKLCNMLFAYAFNTLFARENIAAYVVNSASPADVLKREGTGSTAWPHKAESLPADMLASEYVELSEKRPQVNGLYLSLSWQRVYGRTVNAEDAKRLFKLSERLCNVQYGGYFS